MRRCLRCLELKEKVVYNLFCLRCLVESPRARKKAAKRWRKRFQPEMKHQMMY